MKSKPIQTFWMDSTEKKRGIPMDKNDKKKNDKLTMKKKADKNNPKLKTPYIAGVSAPDSNNGPKPKKTY